ncbi:MAG: radical SAM protein, partial [Bacteroidaceae bacterium]|nr:radical SAM protein [Bacteroidaceae bacterium]
MKQRVYYRPAWTCGRYNKDKTVAIYYNLIEGFSYFFEENSAIVIGFILSIKRNDSFTLDEISKKTGFAKGSLLDFLNQLDELKIISSIEPTAEFTSEYRKKCAEHKCSNAVNTVKRVEEKLPFYVSNAEMEYTNKVNGITGVMLELTYNCSEKCVHCYNPGATRNDGEKSYRGDRDELDINDYKRIIDELYEEGLVKVCLTGGDPFTKRIVWDILDYLYEKEIATDIYTNGQSIVHKVERIANYYPRIIGISIYSGDENEHDYITRVKGSWKKSIDVVKQLTALSVPMNLKCCIMRPNIKNY